ncbi:MAG: hypothetical protein MUE38_05770 [Flavihumibacter sp.]|jgi:hypothetical protein|nr:hypothetical protein [Flavihumibacter sp.]
MKRNFIAVIILLSIGLVAGALIGHYNQQTKVSDYENYLRKEKETSKTWRDNANHWHNKASAEEVRNSTALKDLALVEERLGSLSEQFEGLRKNLGNLSYAGFSGSSSSYKIVTGTKDTIVIFNKDTVNAIGFNYEDPQGWYSVKGVVSQERKIASLKFYSRDSLVSVVYWKRPWLLGKKKFSQEIKSFNPNTRIVYNKAIIVKKQKRF